MPRTDSYPGHLRRLPSGSWNWRVSIGGERRSETWKDDDLTEEEAARKARSRFDELQDQAARGGVVDPRMKALLKRFEDDHLPTLAPSSQQTYTVELKALRTYFVEEGANPHVRRIGRGEVTGYLSWRKVREPDGTKRGKALSAWAVKKAHAVASAAFEIAVERGWREANPVQKVSPPSPDDREPVILSPEEYDRLLEKAEPRPMLHTYLLLLGEGGLRRSEGLRVRWEDVDLEGGFLDVVSGREGRQTKSKRSRSVPMTLRLRRALREHAAAYRMKLYDGERSPWVVHRLRASGGPGQAGDRYKSLRYATGKAVEAAKLPEEFRLHDLRHRRCTAWLRQGHSPELVRRAMGHSSLAVTLKYSHLVRGDLSSMVEEEAREAMKAMKG